MSPQLPETLGVIGFEPFPVPVIYRLREVIDDQVRPAPGGGTAVFHVATGRYRVAGARELGSPADLPMTPELRAAIRHDATKRGIRLEDQ